MLEEANKTIWQELISCHFRNIQRARSTPFGFIFYPKPLTVTRMCVTSRSTNTDGKLLHANAMSEHLWHTGPYHYLWPWQPVSTSSTVSSVLHGSRQAGSGVAVIRPVASTTAKATAEAGWATVPIPDMPCSAICRWAGAEPREGSDSR